MAAISLSLQNLRNVLRGSRQLANIAEHSRYDII